MKPASRPRSPAELRILVVDGSSGATRIVPSTALAALFAPGDLLVVNDAATLPASLSGHTEHGEAIELRLAAHIEERRWVAALFGAGDWRTRTEDRLAPPRVSAGETLFFVDGLVARVTAIRPESPRLLEVALGVAGGADAPEARLWSTLYRAGRPVQYAHVPAPLALWDVQNVYAARPWALEMPSAGRSIRGATLLELRQRGVEIAVITHAAGLSSIGDAQLDATLPLPERYEVGPETWEAIARARRRGRRVVAIGTSVVRALEGGARAGKTSGVTDLVIGPGLRRAIVDAVLTGSHEVGTSHHDLLGAFARPAALAGALAEAERASLLGHEMGDAWLVWGEPREKLRTRPGVSRSARAGVRQC